MKLSGNIIFSIMWILLLIMSRNSAVYAAQVEPLPTPLAGGEILYVVEAGDTIALIAERFGVPVEAITVLNGISAETPLKAGQRLILGVAGQQAEPTQPPSPTEPSQPVQQLPTAPPIDLFRSTPTPQSDGRIVYIVQSGDSLISIAVRFEMTLDEIYAASGLNQSSVLSLGQEIELGRDQGAVVPLAGNIPPRYAGATYREADNAFVHMVRPNETLIEVAVQYEYETMAEFFAVSGLSSDSIVTVGQEVIVGFKPIPQSQGGSTDAPTNTPLPPPLPTDTPPPTSIPTNTPIPFPTTLPTATLSQEQAAVLAAEEVIGEGDGDSAEDQSPVTVPVAHRNIVPAFIGLFGSSLLLVVVGFYLWYRQQ